jgi:hypothetical protein
MSDPNINQNPYRRPMEKLYLTTWLPNIDTPEGATNRLRTILRKKNRIDRAGRLSTFASAATRVRLG